MAAAQGGAAITLAKQSVNCRAIAWIFFGLHPRSRWSFVNMPSATHFIYKCDAKSSVVSSSTMAEAARGCHLDGCTLGRGLYRSMTSNASLASQFMRPFCGCAGLALTTLPVMEHNSMIALSTGACVLMAALPSMSINGGKNVSLKLTDSSSVSLSSPVGVAGFSFYYSYYFSPLQNSGYF